MSSPSFKENDTLPVKFTCDGKDRTPLLRWSPGPPTTESYAIIMEDSDAPGGLFTHWVIYDIPPMLDFLPESLPPIRKLANAETQGTNDFGKLGYGGACPPKEGGEHRYDFRIYAIDKRLDEDAGLTRDALHGLMKGHIVGEGSLTARYKRKS